jgi:hypothetical protein
MGHTSNWRPDEPEKTKTYLATKELNFPCYLIFFVRLLVKINLPRIQNYYNPVVFQIKMLNNVGQVVSMHYEDEDGNQVHTFLMRMS